MTEFWDSETVELQAMDTTGISTSYRNEDGNTGIKTVNQFRIEVGQAVPLDKYFCHKRHWSHDDDADLYDPYNDPASDQYSAW